MIIATEFVVAVRCPSCGKLEFHKVSRFSFSKNKTHKISCTCGTPKLIIGTKNRQQYWFQIPCVLCETNHLVYYKAKQLWADDLTFFYCTDADIELGYFGPEEKVKTFAENYDNNLDSLVEELGYDDYFSSPDIMFEILNSLHEIAEEGFLYCDCGNFQIEIDIFPDRIELECKHCNSTVVVFAETEDDLRRIQSLKKIELVKSGFKCLDSFAKVKKSRPTKKSRH